MRFTSLIRMGLAALVISMLAACGSNGSNGSAGPAGPAGAAGPAGPAGADKTTGTVDATNLTFNDLTNRALAVTITSADTSGDKPVVNFKVSMKDSGEGVRGLRTFTLQIAQLKPALDGSPSYWQNYIAAGLPLTAVPAFTERGASVQTAPKNPSADAVSVYNTDGTVKAQGYTVVDNGDGTYAVTFGANIKANTNVPYDATLTHRIGVGVRSVVVPGVVGKTAGAYAGPINPTTGAAFGAFTNTNGAVDVYDFTPSATGPGTKLATPARDNVTVAACNQCHYKIEYGFPKGNNTSGHFGARPDTKFCVMCHTPQNADGFVGQGDFTNFIHKIHMGDELPVPETLIGVDFSEVKYPQDQRNCTTCHKGTVTDSWANPSRKACGACHNNVNFATGANHIGGSKADDKQCALCHGAPDIALNHTPVAKVTSASSGVTTPYADNANLPAGAFKIDYVINSVTVDAARNVSIKFQIKKDGTAVNFGTYNAATNPNIIPGTVGGPSLRIAYNVSQDGITSPADFNASMSLPGLGIGAPTVPSTATPPGTFTPASTASSVWVNAAGVTSGGITWTMTGPDATNAYTIKSSLVLPASTTMVSALMYGAMTETAVAGYPYAAASIADFTPYISGANTAYALTKPGLIVASPNALKAATGTGLTARRTVVDNAKCNSCHKQLGIKPNFHGGGRNDGTDCHICHTPSGNNGGWSYGANTFIHAIHGAAQRTTNYTFQAASATDGFFTVGYPGLLKNCEQCHLSGTYDLSASASAAAVGKQLVNTVATGTTAAAGVTTAPYIAQTAGTKYGVGYSFAAPGNAAAAYTLADGVTAGTWTDLATNTSVASLTALTNTAGAIRQAEGTTLVSSPISAACFSCHDSATAISHMEINGGSIYDARAAALNKTETCLVCHGAVSSTNITNNTTPAIKAVHRWW